MGHSPECLLTCQTVSARFVHRNFLELTEWSPAGRSEYSADSPQRFAITGFDVAGGRLPLSLAVDAVNLLPQHCGANRFPTGITVISQFLLLLLRLLLRRNPCTDADLRLCVDVARRTSGCRLSWLENLLRWGVLEFRPMIAVRVRRYPSPDLPALVPRRMHRYTGACHHLISDGGHILRVSPGGVDQDKG